MRRLPCKFIFAAGFHWIVIVSAFFLLIALASTLNAQVSYDLTDLGTLGGSSSSAASMAGQHGRNAAGMIVGTSKAADNSSRAFLYSNGQMLDLNSLCDLSKTNFAILTAATSIDDDGAILGAGTLTDGTTHAFLAMPVTVDGGRWSASCGNWVWKQVDGSTGQTTGWWWEAASHRYIWHGREGKHPGCPSNPPHCGSWPLPCPPETGSTPYPTPTPTPTSPPGTTPTPTPGLTPTPTSSPGETPTPTPVPGTPIQFPHDTGLIPPTPIPFPHEVGIITPTPAPGNGYYWCCDGTSDKAVVKKGSECDVLHRFQTEADAAINCPGMNARWFCCWSDAGSPAVDPGLTVSQCMEKGGTAYNTLEEATACSLAMKTNSLKTTIHPGTQFPKQRGPINDTTTTPNQLPNSNPRFPNNNNSNNVPSNSTGNNSTPQNIPRGTPHPRITPLPKQHGTPNPNITKGRKLPRSTPTPQQKSAPIHIPHHRLSPSPTPPVIR